MHTPNTVLKQYWGFDNFRPLQEDIIRSILDNKDTLALLPTGGGKSICFQVPALCLEGTCLVISPLIALMKDQVYNLERRGISAVAIHSGLGFKEVDRILDQVVDGVYKFVYLSPERLQTEMFKARFPKMQISFVAIDESHCISQWGYDFRPPYLKIAELRTEKPDLAFLALTATATPQVVLDIQEKLAFRKQNVFQKSFSRSNLSYSVLYEDDKMGKMLEIIQKIKGVGIIYSSNRKSTEVLANYLRARNITAEAYHAGLSPDERERRQDRWMKNFTRIMVCTNAFGMGIDKPDVRFVIHADMPQSLEAYFQEAGRAGRDEKKAYAVMVYHPKDKQLALKNLETAFPELTVVRNVYDLICAYLKVVPGTGFGAQYTFDILQFCTTYQQKPIIVFSCLDILARAGYLQLSDSFKNSSRVLFVVDEFTLYEYEVRNPVLTPLIQALIRSYGGIKENYVAINESTLAARLNSTKKDIESGLKYLKTAGIIDYEPQNEDPFIIFLSDRIEGKHLHFTHESYHFLKENRIEKLNQMLHYATEKAICRSVMLLNYFGEVKEDTCGICDVCLGRNITTLNDEFIQTVKARFLMTELKQIPLNNFLQLFSSAQKAKVLQAIEWLTDSKFFVLDDEDLLKLNP